MKTMNPRATQSIALVATAVALFLTVQCGGSTTAATSTTAISAVALSTTSVAAGGSGQGTVTLAAVAPAGGVNLALASSNAAVATVPPTVTVPAGASSATFTVTAVAVGTASITASMNGSSMQSPTLTVTAKVSLTALTLLSASVVGGESVIGTVTLSAPAPSGGASVGLSGADPVTLPASVTVLGGATSATFSAFTRSVAGTISSIITASYGGTSMSVAVAITAPTVATASFGITGPTESDTCTMTNAGTTINCTFNGSTSRAPGTIVAWDWTYGVASTFSQTTTGPVLANPTVSCSLMPPPPLPAAPASQFFTLVVSLRVHDNLGNVSDVVTNRFARLIPQGVCGF